MNTALATRDDVTIDGEIVEQHAPLTLFGTDDPAAVVERATKVATVLADVIKQRHLSARIGGRDHIMLEGWTLLGSMLGVFGETEWTRPVDRGWEARAVARTMAGVTVGAAEAMCTRAERTWSNRDEYAIRSMAQTRALSKALRLPLGFIVELAGFAATPAEEMDSVHEQPEPRPRGQRPHAAQSHAGTPSSAPAPRNKGEAQQLWAETLRAHSMSFAQGEALAKDMGIDRGSASVEDLLRLIAAIEQPESGDSALDVEDSVEAPDPAPQSEDRAHASDVGEGSADGPSPDIETPPAARSSGRAAAATPEAGGSPPAAPPPAASSSFSDPASFEVYGAAVLGWEEPQPLKDWTPAEWDQVFASLGLSDLTAFQSWYTSLDRQVRAALMTAHQSPTARREAAKAAAKGKPDAEALRMGLES